MVPLPDPGRSPNILPVCSRLELNGNSVIAAQPLFDMVRFAEILNDKGKQGKL